MLIPFNILQTLLRIHQFLPKEQKRLLSLNNYLFQKSQAMEKLFTKIILFLAKTK